MATFATIGRVAAGVQFRKPMIPTISPNAEGEPTYHTMVSQDGHAVRAIVADGIIWLVAADLCRALKLRIGGKFTPARYLGALDHNEKGYQHFPTASGLQRCAVLTVSGAVALTLQRSRRTDQAVRAWIEAEAAKLCPPLRAAQGR